MTYAEAVKSGFRLVNKKWQLVAVQAGMMLANCVAFFVMVGVPLGVAFIIFGLDLTRLAEIKDFLGMFRDPAELLSKYFWLILIVLTSVLLYAVLVATVWLFVFSGSAGIIGRTLLEPSLKFSMRSFFGEARRLFVPLMWFSLLIGLLFLVAAFILGFLSGGVAAVVSFARAEDSTLALFLGIFFSLIVLLAGVGMIVAVLAVTVFGVAILYFKGQRAFRTLKEAFLFLWKNPDAFWLYALVLGGYVLASFILMLIVYPFNLIPLIGTIISLPFQLVLYIVQGYLGLVILAVVFTFYYHMEIRGDVPEGEIKDENSIAGEDTSPAETSGPETTPPASDEPGQS